MTSDKLLSTDLTPITLEKAGEQLDLWLSLQRPVFLHGPVGVGKSDLIAQIGKKSNRKVIDLRMSQMDISDLRGIPFFDTITSTMKWAPPVCLPTNPEDNSILFLDEINCASPSIQATAYQLILDRKVGEYKLPEGVSVVAAGNREKDKGATFKMATPLLNRFVHIEVKYDFTSWKKWAKNNSIHPAIINYLSDYQEDLVTFDPKNQDRAFATPRTWKYVSDCLYHLISPEKSVNKKVLSTAIESCIGSALSTKFSKWFSMNGSISIDDVLAGKVTKAPEGKKSRDFLMAFSHELGARLTHLSNDTNNQQKAIIDDFINNAFIFMVNSSENNKDVPMGFLTTLTKKYQIKINYERSTAITTFLNQPGVGELLNKVAIDAFDESR